MCALLIFLGVMESVAVNYYNRRCIGSRQGKGSAESGWSSQSATPLITPDLLQLGTGTGAFTKNKHNKNTSTDFIDIYMVIYRGSVLF